MSDEFTNNVAQKFPNTLNREPIERPWDVAEPRSISPLEKPVEELKKDDLTERIDTLYSELRSSLTVRSALEFDMKKANRILEEVNRVKAEVEKIIEMLRVMDEYKRAGRTLSFTSESGTPAAERRSSRTSTGNEISGEADRKEGDLRISQEGDRDRTGSGCPEIDRRPSWSASRLGPDKEGTGDGSDFLSEDHPSIGPRQSRIAPPTGGPEQGAPEASRVPVQIDLPPRGE